MGDANTEGVERSSQTDPLVGRRLASYEVLARVARGGMGVVYRARHVYIDKIVALKVLDPALAEREDLIERFRIEAQSLARVEHDNVVKVIDILEDGGVHFIVMDFAEGTNLRNLVRKNGPMGGGELLSVARQAAEALYAAHRQGILHRDIKPENLIMNARGRCKLADFGLAGDMRLISEGHEGPVNFGTPAYSAPEVLRRMVPDKRSDIFSYGATLYFLATGGPPFGQSDSRSVMLRQRQGAELLDARRADLPGKLSGLIMDCIAFHPKDRPDGFREVMDRLPRRFIPRTVEQTATAPTEPVDFDSGTHETPRGLAPPKLAIVAVVAAVMAVALVLTLWLWPRESSVNDANATGPENTSADDLSPPENPPPADDEVEDGDDGPAFLPEDEAFSSAELESREALRNTDYRAAYAAWESFLRIHPDSEHAEDARRSRRDVMNRVHELREKSYEKTYDLVRELLEEKRTAEAMAAIDRFPDELLVPLDDADEVGVSGRLDTQRRVIEAADAADLAALMQQADRLRAEWTDDRKNPELSEIRRMRSAGNLLAESELLENFLPGRLAETRARAEERLKTLRKLLEGVHQDAMARVDAWRRFHDQVLGEWAARAITEIDESQPELERRQFELVVNRMEELSDELRSLKDSAANAASDYRVGEQIGESTFVADLLDRYVKDLTLARNAFVSVESALRLERRANNVREYFIHRGRDEDGSLDARLDRVTGRVVSVAGDEFVVDSEDGRRTLQAELLSAGTVRKLIRARGDFDDQLRLVAWLTAIGRDADADAEFAYLTRMDVAPDDVLERGRALVGARRLAPEAQRRLRYLTVRTGLRRPADLEEELGTDTLESSFAAAQAGVEGGDAEAAKRYVELVNGTADPEMVDLDTFERALESIDAKESALRMRVLLEPLHPAAYAHLARELQDQGDRVQAGQMAGKALLLDPSNELAFRIRSK